MEDYYSIMGVAPTATNEEITKRYRFLALAYHPDRFSNEESKSEASREMARINVAYQVLSDPLKRAAYDRQREGKSASGGNSTTGGHGAAQDSRQSNNRIDEAFQYFELLIRRWGSYIQLSDQHIQLKRTVQELASIARTISSRLSGHLGAQGVQLFLEEFEEGLKAAVVVNVALGIELEAASPPTGFDRPMLGDYSVIPIRAQLNFLLDYGLGQGVYSSSDKSEVNQRVINQLREICQAGQQVGKEIAINLRAGTNNTSRQETRTGQSHHQRPLIQYCQACGALTDTKPLTFRRIIGYFIFAQFRTVKGEMCVQCAAKYFWEFTGTTLLLGWLWPGAFLVPFFFLANWINYGKYKELREKAGHFENPAPGWKAVTLIIVIAFVITGISIGFSDASAINTTSAGNYSNINSPTTNNQIVRPTSASAPAVAPKPLPTKVPTKRSLCKRWNEVSSSDKGDRICVYGIVENAYRGDEQRFFITFSERKTDFRFIVLGGYYYKDVIGYCVEATGEVKAYEEILYMELGDKITRYPISGKCP